MARILITGSSQGLGLMAGQLLIARGHAVVLHGRDSARAEAACATAPGAAGAVIGDLSILEAMHAVARQAEQNGPYDAVIHNVGVGYLRTSAVTAADLVRRRALPASSNPMATEGADCHAMEPTTPSIR